MSEHFPNSYVVSIFACCRQLYFEKNMSGCAPKENVTEPESPLSLEEASLLGTRGGKKRGGHDSYSATTIK